MIKKTAKKPTKYKSKLTKKWKPLKATDNVKELKKYGYKLAGATQHTDTNSHNVRLKIVSGLENQLRKDKDQVIEKLRKIYGDYASALIMATKKADKNSLTKRMREIRKEILQYKKSK